MPQYLAPGVYVEEIPGPRTIQGVSTSVAAFVGPTRFGPISGRPELLTSYADFVNVYGDAADLIFTGSGTITNFVALGAKGFFDEGGSSLYVARTPGTLAAAASKDVPSPDPASKKVTLKARQPGKAGNLRVTLTLRRSDDRLHSGTLSRVREYDTVWIASGDTTKAGVASIRRDDVTGKFVLSAPGGIVEFTDATSVHALTVLVEVEYPTIDAHGVAGFGPKTSLGEFGLDERAPSSALTKVLAAVPPTTRQQLTLPVMVDDNSITSTGETRVNDLAHALFKTTALDGTAAAEQTVVTNLEGGTDGGSPTSVQYDSRLADLESIQDISIVAAPGSSTGWKASGGDTEAQAIAGKLVTHCENLRYRVAALDVPPAKSAQGALDFRNLRSSTHAAIYYPWLTVAHPLTGDPVTVPPSGYLAGVWARSDNARGVIKAPANEVVRSAIGLETHVNKAQQDLLNPEGVNCLRYFPGSGFLVWGARTISDDPEWKYLSIRRYFNYVERSLDQGTQWVVFEINGPTLWDAVRHTIEGFLFTEWKNGALLGRTPEQGYFVRCDESTMTPDDLDNGRLICQIGIAAAKPAEFVIFRISQFTATTSS